ncbi:MFS general substrate transporter [Rhizodiscina lignyota]|uniref:MFS general substrate transporter n=1 Tax=Rhizodiscina lignyota TaxID=1504668 RepID=A0A9P4IHF6_9PEZI|nr:MFS general substrate transporter [Rhizodiscina lignyota]
MEDNTEKPPVRSEVEEEIEDPKAIDEDNAAGKIFSIDDVDLPDGYFRSVYFWGSMFAIGMSLMCGVAGFSYIAPILSFVNEDIGPSPYITWVALTYTLTGSVGLMIVGRLTDIFGRRWFFVIGSALALLGSIVCAVAPNIPAMIAGETIIGLGSSAQLSFVFAVGELVPMRYRILANSYCYLWLIPPNPFGPVVGYAFQYNTRVKWRGVFYLLTGLNALCTASWYFFYHPPTFVMKHGHGRKLKYIKEFDYIGTALATLGLLLFLMGLSWGGSLYPWKSAHVIACIIIGFLLLVAFFLYEAYMPLKEPLLPMHLMKNRGWLVLILIWSIGASVYYAFAIIWPDMITGLYAEGHGHIWAGWASGVVGAGITLGEILAGFVKKKMHWVIRFIFFTGCALLAAMASCTPDTPTRAIVILLLGTTFIGANECLTSTCATICLDDQREIGTALGIGGSSRSFFSTLCSTVYTVVLSNRLAKTIPSQVPPALIAAGLPPGSTEAFLAAYTNGTQAAFDAVPGLTPSILATGTRAYKFATADAYRTVFLTTIAFSAIGFILTWFVPDVDAKLTGEVAVTLHAKTNEEFVGEAKSPDTKAV